MLYLKNVLFSVVKLCFLICAFDLRIIGKVVEERTAGSPVSFFFFI
jgi:hypothetical protein